MDAVEFIKERGRMCKGSEAKQTEIGVFCIRDDVVQVVRCKDCKYYRESRVLAPNKFCFRLNHPTEPGKIGYNFADDDFCSRGVRRNEGKQ